MLRTLVKDTDFLVDIEKYIQALLEEDFDIDGEFCLLPTKRQPLTLEDELEEAEHYAKLAEDEEYRREFYGPLI